MSVYSRCTLFVTFVLALAGCDASPSYDTALSSHATPSWVLPTTAPAADVFFSALTVRPGGVIRTVLERSDAPDAPRLTIRSERTFEHSDEHRIGLDVSGVTVEEVELFIKRLEDGAFVSVQTANNFSEIDESVVDRAPQSAHYVERPDPSGDGTIWVLVNDFQQTGATFRSAHTEGDTAIDHIGYRVRVKQQEGRFTQLRIDGYDDLAVESVKRLAGADLQGRVAEFTQATR